MKLLGVFGFGGCGRGVAPLLRSRVDAGDELVFVDDEVVSCRVNGHRALTWDEFLAEPAEQRMISLAVANGQLRADLARRCERAGVAFVSVCADNLIVMDDVQIGEGAILSPHVTLTSNIRVGRHFHANLYSYVEHDCEIGDFVTFAPGVKCNGNVRIEDFAYIGAGAMIRQGRPGDPLVIGRGAVVGMGAVVTRSVKAGVTVVGNPARELTGA